MKKIITIFFVLFMTTVTVPVFAEEYDVILDSEEDTETIIESEAKVSESVFIDTVEEVTDDFTAVISEETAEKVEISSDNFPDKIFRDYISADLDTDTDGFLSQDEISNVEVLSISGNTITDLTGIEYFTNLLYLNCSDNKLMSLDVSQNTNLISLICSSNNLYSLDTSNNIKLTTLECGYNYLTSLNLIENTELVTLACEGNNLSALDLTENTVLNSINCSDNNLSSLSLGNVESLTILRCSENSLPSLDVSSCIGLILLDCRKNDISSIDLSNCTKLETLYCGENALSSLNMDNNSELLYLDCNENSIDELILKENTALRYLYCQNNSLSEIDISSCTSLLELVCYDNALSSLDVSNSPALEYLTCASNSLSNLDVSNNGLLWYLDCSSNNLVNLNLSDNENLKYLACGRNQIADLDLNLNENLENLYCQDNQLTELKLNSNINLYSLSCYGNCLTGLDLNSNENLWDFNLSPQKLTVSAYWLDGAWTISLDAFSNTEKLFIYDWDTTEACFADSTLLIYDLAFPEIYTIGASVTVGNTIEEMEIVLTLEPENDASVDISKCSLTFDPPYDLLYDGNPKTAAVSLLYRDNYSLEEGTDYTVTYDDNVNAGLVTVTISGSGFFTGSIEQTFAIEKAGQALNVLSGDFCLSVGQTDQIFVSGIGEISYSSGNTSIAVVDEKGLVTGVSDGETTIRATAAGNNNYSGDSVEFSVIVYSLSSDPDYDYSTPDTDKEDGIETETEAEIKQSENSDSAQTETTVKLSVCTLKSFTNTAKGITLKWKKVTNASGYYIYRKTGTESYKRISTIKNGSTVSYTDKSVKNINGTTYTYKIVPYSENSTGIGTVKIFVRLTGVKLTSVKNSSSKKATVKWKKTTKVSGYQIQYSTSKTFAKGNKAIKVSGAKKTSKTLTGLKKGKTYYVRIRTYKKVNGKTYYSAWSSKMKVKIGK